MAVPPLDRSPDPAGLRHSWLLDVLLGLLVLVALPLAIVAIPNTLSVVADLLPGEFDQIGLSRTHGLALPALMLTVPLAAVVLRRVKVAHLLVAGLALVAVADAAGGYASSELVVGVVRVLRGVGGGLIIPATLVAVWDRAPVLRGLWAGVLGVSLLEAQAFALWPLVDVTSWKVTLQPYPMVTGVALALAAAYLMVWRLAGRRPAPAPDAGEGGRLLLAAVPAAGIAVVAVSTATAGWGVAPVILLAGLAIAGLLVLGSAGRGESRTHAYTMVAVGVVLLPSAAQVTLVEMGGLGGPGLRGLWVPFGVAAVFAIAAGVGVRMFAKGVGRVLAPLGLLAMVVGLCSVRLVVPSADGLVLAVPFTLLAVGATVAVTATLGEVGVGAAAFGLSLCFAGVLAGYLLGTGVQMWMLGGVSSRQELVDSFVGALHWWSLVGGFLLVGVIVLAAVMGRRSSREEASPSEGEPAGVAVAVGAGGRSEAVAEEPVRTWGSAVPEGSPARKKEREEEGEPAGPVPAVPPQAPSPEDDEPS
ncbi:hypothetical protein ACIBIZ_41490 [Nonomuraea spiralis]|uniref:hypothetical protein n=1 Tax=Nonomuraea TaxID=83681 RepID=UPI000F77AD98|nr:hypothetical protein [Nonomuraea sp. WAC 01424]